MSLLTGIAPGVVKDFDPDAYLRDKAGAFDPDAYLRAKQVHEMAKNVGPAEALGAGAAQGATLGFGDEIQGVVQAAGQKVLPEKLGGIDYGKSFKQLYKESRDTKRMENDAAREAHGGMYMAGEIGGGVAPTVLAGGAAKALPRTMALAQGATQGAGYSNADSAGGVARDSAFGGLLGLAGHEAGAELSKAGAPLASAARGKASNAAARAGAQAAEEESGKVASLQGAYGGLRQTENKAIINSLEREKSGLLDQANLAKLQQLKQSGRVAQALNESSANDLEFLATRGPEVQAAKQAYQQAQSALPQSIAARTAELSKPQIGADLKSLAKSYAEPIIAAAVAPTGMKEAAGLIFGRTRAGKAIATRLNRPGNQIALWDAVQAAANAPESQAGQFLRRALTAGATARFADPALAQ